MVFRIYFNQWETIFPSDVCLCFISGLFETTFSERGAGNLFLLTIVLANMGGKRELEGVFWLPNKRYWMHDGKFFSIIHRKTLGAVNNTHPLHHKKS